MSRRRPLDKVNTNFIIIAHVLAVVAILYMVFFKFSWMSLGLGVFYAWICTLSISAGYHRLFSHPTYRAHGILRALYLFFGGASIQNSALKWSADHRVHHSQVDRKDDPYNIRKGFWWAHIGWVLHASPEHDLANVPDLKKDKLVMWQHDNYLLCAILASGVLPLALGFLWGDPIGAVLIAGFLRIVVNWHTTFSINSIAHIIGSRPYSLANSARDSFITAVVTMGEGYHNFHHRFANDYRNGVRWFHFDPTKWWVWSWSKVGLTWDLKRASREAILDAREKVKEEVKTMKKLKKLKAANAS
ncbi:MAG: acyl-CoA desaturase [Planctomycetota bacterium]|nr:acyl-CoA desaturase [Planctomycetota bacterium]MDA1113769.1 acyl-CoA desaturase [Planctomycetota bacterium]